MDEALRTAIKQIESLGAEAIEVSLPHTPRHSCLLFDLICGGKLNLAKYDDGSLPGTPNEMWKACSISISRLLEKGFGQETKSAASCLGHSRSPLAIMMHTI